MAHCPLFGICGGCKFDFAAPDYRSAKQNLLKKVPATTAPVWTDFGTRRRADFCFAAGQFGFYEASSKNIVPLTHCPNLSDEINQILPDVARLPFGASGACLITACDNGIDIAITSDVPYFSAEFKKAALRIPAIRITWNGIVVNQTTNPTVSFDGHTVSYPTGVFLQPTIQSADVMRKMVLDAAVDYKRRADLFCGLGNFTFALNADGFDVVGTGMQRDLFKNPLTLGMLAGYDCVVMDPPRAGADAQSKVLAKSNVKRIIYISCNPTTWLRDAQTLQRGGYKLTQLTPVDQFVGSTHWELFSIFDK